MILIRKRAKNHFMIMSLNSSENISTERNYGISSDTHRIFPPTPNDEIVISGVAGRYPSCENVDELCENLFNKVTNQ